MEVCILLSTCDKYINLAKLTAEIIHQRWENHPQIFACGLSYPYPTFAKLLQLKDDPQDWIGIIESATCELLEKGYRKCYLILDDHPPIQACNEVHLNKTLPTLMDRLNAAYIGLHGWDQNTLASGKILDARYFYLQRQPPFFLWQYSLHPALWNLQALQDMAGALPKLNNDIATRSIWAFERRTGAIPSPIPQKWQERSYRIFGLGMLGGEYRLVRRIVRRSLYLLLNLLLFVVKNLFGAAIQEKLAEHYIYETLFFDGPYPLYWSGVMQKGKLNSYFERYLLIHGRKDELASFQNLLNS